MGPQANKAGVRKGDEESDPGMEETLVFRLIPHGCKEAAIAPSITSSHCSIHSKERKRRLYQKESLIYPSLFLSERSLPQKASCSSHNPKLECRTAPVHMAQGSLAKGVTGFLSL